jgi:RimJ/RimL family protein N-acetyltransferase
MNLTLKKCNPETDLYLLYDLFVSKENICSYIQLPIFSNKEHWKQWIQQQMSGYFKELYIFTDSLDICGFAVAYDYRANDRHCKVHFCFRKGIRAESVKLFVSLMFREFSLNKIFIEVIAEDSEVLSGLQRIGFRKEAEFPNYIFMGGEHHTLSILGLYSSEFYGG